MKQYHLESNTLILNVKKGPLMMRSVLFFFAFFGFVAPLAAIGFALSNKSGLHFGFFISIFIFGLMGFYLLRLSLWNNYGKETIKFENGDIHYFADYGWFKDGRKNKPLIAPLQYDIEKIGYEEDHKGRLIISSGNEVIKCVTTMPIPQIEQLINELGKLN